jgi:hypothetical protein
MDGGMAGWIAVCMAVCMAPKDSRLSRNGKPFTMPAISIKINITKGTI